MTLTPSLTPPERMAEIRRLARRAVEFDTWARKIINGTDRRELAPGEFREAFLDYCGEVMHHLSAAEADGSLAECEEMLRVSHAGVL